MTVGCLEIKEKKEWKDFESSHTLFECFRQNHHKVFSTFAEFEMHLEVGKHADVVPGRNASVRQNAKRLDKQTSDGRLDRKPTYAKISLIYAMGWALHATRPSAPITATAKRYLTAKFDLGERTGQKYDPSKVALDMRTTRK